LKEEKETGNYFSWIKSLEPPFKNNLYFKKYVLSADLGIRDTPSSSKIDLTEKLRFFIVKSLLVFVNFFKQVI